MLPTIFKLTSIIISDDEPSVESLVTSESRLSPSLNWWNNISTNIISLQCILSWKKKAGSNFGDVWLNVTKVIKSSDIITCKLLLVSIWIVSSWAPLTSHLGEAFRCLVKVPMFQEFPWGEIGVSLQQKMHIKYIFPLLKVDVAFPKHDVTSF